jgi:hypothetical protein
MKLKLFFNQKSSTNIKRISKNYYSISNKPTTQVEFQYH